MTSKFWMVFSVRHTEKSKCSSLKAMGQQGFYQRISPKLGFSACVHYVQRPTQNKMIMRNAASFQYKPLNNTRCNSNPDHLRRSLDKLDPRWKTRQSRRRRTQHSRQGGHTKTALRTPTASRWGKNMCSEHNICTVLHMI